jgi:ribosomal protein S18 acetylase RimI-like enzyme
VDAPATIRAATIDDVDEVVHLRMEFLREFAQQDGKTLPDSLPRAIRAYAERTLPIGALRFWIAELDGRVAGCCALLMIDRPPSLNNLSGLTAYLLNVYTVPACRRRGVASALLREALRHAREAGAGRVWPTPAPRHGRCINGWGLYRTATRWT